MEHPQFVETTIILFYASIPFLLTLIYIELSSHNKREEARDFKNAFSAEAERDRNRR